MFNLTQRKITLIFLLCLESALLPQPNDLSSKCSQGLCDDTGGTCVDGLCICKKGFSTYLSPRNHSLCNYKQKSSLTAALLELFFGTGTGHFYAGRKVNGMVKMCCQVFFCFSCCLSFFLIRKLEQDVRAVGHPHISFLFIFAFTIGISLFFWQFVDFFLFIFGLYYDGNNMPLF